MDDSSSVKLAQLFIWLAERVGDAATSRKNTSFLDVSPCVSACTDCSLLGLLLVAVFSPPPPLFL